MRVPSSIPCDGLSGMLRARDGILAMWERDLMEVDEAILRLRALSTVDSSGATWRIRPSVEGVLFLREGRDGVPVAAHPREFVRRRTSSENFLWVTLAAMWLGAVALFAFQ